MQEQEPEMEPGILKTLIICVVVKTDTESFPRGSNDIQMNRFGNQLINVFDMYESMILSRLVECGFDEGYTYIKNRPECHCLLHHVM